jgi:DNA-binding LytR/AlgR family response regulator
MTKMKGKIYIVEDQGVTRTAIRSILENADYYISGDAATAEKAWIELQELETDLVLIDFNLKGTKNGLWLAEKINSFLKIPFIYLTAYGSDEFLEKIMKTKPSGYIMKPYNKPTLLSNVEIVMNKKIKEEKPKYKNHIEFIKTRTGLIKISEQNLLYVQSNKNYVQLHTTDGLVETRDKLEHFLEQVNFHCLYRVHRRFAVNSKFVYKMDNDCIYINQECIPTSKSYEAEKLKEICLNKDN